MFVLCAIPKYVLCLLTWWTGLFASLGDVIILEEAAYVSSGFFYETVAPLLCVGMFILKNAIHTQLSTLPWTLYTAQLYYFAVIDTAFDRNICLTLRIVNKTCLTLLFDATQWHQWHSCLTLHNDTLVWRYTMTSNTFLSIPNDIENLFTTSKSCSTLHNAIKVLFDTTQCHQSLVRHHTMPSKSCSTPHNDIKGLFDTKQWHQRLVWYQTMTSKACLIPDNDN